MTRNPDKDQSDFPAALPGLRGRLRKNALLGSRSWFRTGGAADWLLIPEDQEDLAYFLRHCPREMPLTILGACSNVIIRDGGIEGIVIRLAGGFSSMIPDISPSGESGLIVGAAALDVTIAEYAARHGLEGLEFLSGIPGSIGGAICMNAGAYGRDMRDILDWVEVLAPTPKAECLRLEADLLPMRYRHGGLPENCIVLRARLKAIPGDKQIIMERMAEIRQKRETSQPLRTRTGGSTFRNPEGHKAWALIDAAGCRGLRRGDAQISEKHCNFMLNLGAASSADLEALGEEVRQRVKEQSNITLQWEIKRLGRER